MAFPPNFTNNWDTTFPVDTELANLLGNNLRQLRVDVMQRMSLLSGLFSNRPTPEIVNATWGGVGYGLIYLSTDTGQLFQWSGAAWTDITTSFSGTKDYDDYTTVIFAGAAPGNIRTVNIPVGAVQNANVVGSYLEIETGFHIGGSVGTAPTYNLSFNGSNVMSATLLGIGDYVSKTTVFLSNAALPRIYSTFSKNGAVGIVLKSGLGAPIDGTALVPVADSFAISTTLTATCDYMHIRVRK